MTVEEIESKNKFLGSMFSIFSLAEEKLGTLEMFSIKDASPQGRIQFKLNMNGSLSEADKMMNSINELLNYNPDIMVSVVKDKKENYVVIIFVESTDWDAMYKYVDNMVLKEIRSNGSRQELLGGKSPKE